MQLTTTALDCIGKLISYSYFSIGATRPASTPPLSPQEGGTEAAAAPKPEDGKPAPSPKPPLIERAIETICDCFQGEGTNEAVQLQIIKSLLAAVLNDKAVVHGAGLLKAVRQTYNIFLLSKSSPHQMTAQGTLTQMVHTVFERVKARIAVKEANLRGTLGGGDQGGRSAANGSSTTINIPIHGDDLSAAGAGDAESASGEVHDTPVHHNKSQEKITLQSFENRKSFDDDRMADTTTVTTGPVVTVRSTGKPALGGDGVGSQAGSNSPGDTQEEDEEDEIFTKDAFLVFRAMCKLSIKNLPVDQLADLKSHGMRSKLLSLHLIHTILQTHSVVFTHPLVTIRSHASNEQNGFVDAIKQYLCLSLSRNAASAVGLVFEVCCEIFWLVLRDMRVMLKVCPVSYLD